MKINILISTCIFYHTFYSTLVYGRLDNKHVLLLTYAVVSLYMNRLTDEFVMSRL